MGRDARIRAAVALVATAAASVAGLLVAVQGAGVFAILSVSFVAGAGLGAVFACLTRVRVAPAGGRLPWVLLAGAAAFELADRTVIWISTPHAEQLTGISSGALLHISAAALAAVGVARLRAPTPDRAASRRGLLDGATIFVAVAMVTGNTVFTPEAQHAVSDAARAMASVVSGTDVVLAVLGLVVLSRARYAGGSNLRTLLPLCAGAVSLAAGDAGVTGAALTGTRSSGSPASLFVSGGLVLVLSAALGQEGADDEASMPRRERIAVSAAVGPVVLAALAVAVYQVTTHHLPPMLAAGVFLVSGLLLGRLIVSSLDNLVLSRTLESQVDARTLELVTREQWFRSLIQHSSDVVTVLDASGVVRYQSPAIERLFGYEPVALIGSTMSGLLRPMDVSRLQAAIVRATAMPGASFVLEFPVSHRDGTWRDTETVITSLLDVPDVRGLVLNTRDVSDRKQLQERLAHQAYHDALTGLANRSLFQQRLASALTDPTADQVAVLFCDLDAFKAVNDSQGHDVGDALLGMVAERLRRCVRDGDLVARFGGDEFAVLVRDADARTAARGVAERMEQSLRRPFSLDGREVRVGVSIGIAMAEPGAESVDVLLRNADLAMYRAKADQHVAVVVFEREMHDALLARLAVEDDLRTALGSGQLVLHYQPTVELATGVPVGVEALMRWYRPGRGIVSPHEFIGVAEDNGFIDAMGQWALFEACTQAAVWQRYAKPGAAFSVGVNISARQVTPGLVDVVAAAIAEASIPPSALLLEMTESVLLGRADEAVEVLQALKRLGVRIAIDDFGKGFSSLSYLSRFPVDVLKIDKDFIADADNAGQRAELARTIVHLGRSLRLATIAEGIETQAQRQALMDMGCEFGQGYLFSRPLPANGVTVLLQGGRPHPEEVAVGLGHPDASPGPTLMRA